MCKHQQQHSLYTIVAEPTERLATKWELNFKGFVGNIGDSRLMNVEILIVLFLAP